VWVIFFGYAFFLFRRQRGIEAELESLRRELEERERDSD
jgi:CcmD family protein